MSDNAKTIAELEAILNSEDNRPVNINPDGTITIQHTLGDIDELPATTVIMRADQVWAEEPGRSVRFTEINNGGAVRIEIMDDRSRMISATIGRWRWDRIVRALALESKP